MGKRFDKIGTSAIFVALERFQNEFSQSVDNFRIRKV